MILPLNTGTHQLSDNPTISSILPNSNTPQVGNIVGKPSTNETTEKIEAQLTTMKRYMKCEIYNIDLKSAKSNAILQKKSVLLFCKMN